MEVDNMNNSVVNTITEIASQASINRSAMSASASRIVSLSDQIDQHASSVQSLVQQYPDDPQLNSQASAASASYQQASEIMTTINHRLQVASTAFTMVHGINYQVQVILENDKRFSSVTKSYAALAASYRADFNSNVAGLYQSLADSAASIDQPNMDSSLTSLMELTSSAAAEILNNCNALNQAFTMIQSANVEAMNAYSQASMMAEQQVSFKALNSQAMLRKQQLPQFNASLSAVTQQAQNAVDDCVDGAHRLASMINYANGRAQQLTFEAAEIQRRANQIAAFGTMEPQSSVVSLAAQLASEASVASSTATSCSTMISNNDELVTPVKSLLENNRNLELITSLAVQKTDSYNAELATRFAQQDYSGATALGKHADTAASIATSGASHMAANTDSMAALIHVANQRRAAFDGGGAMIKAKYDEVNAIGNSLASMHSAANLTDLIHQTNVKLSRSRAAASAAAARSKASLRAVVSSANLASSPAENTASVAQVTPEGHHVKSTAASYDEKTYNQHHYDEDYQRGLAQAQSDHLVPKKPKFDTRGYLDGYVSAFNQKLLLHPNHSYNRKSVYVYRKDVDNKSKVVFYDLKLKHLGRYRHQLLKYFFDRKSTRLFKACAYEVKSIVGILTRNYFKTN
ncbi:hypothetical protein [Nicoliella spurrieriana]|nr:hypothetical protein [Nicoliella spurrieriana]